MRKVTAVVIAAFVVGLVVGLAGPGVAQIVRDRPNVNAPFQQPPPTDQERIAALERSVRQLSTDLQAYQQAMAAAGFDPNCPLIPRPLTTGEGGSLHVATLSCFP